MDRVSKAERELVQKIQKQTNADKIRQMSDEELAAWLTFIENKILEKQPKLGRAELEADWLYWLKHEVKKDVDSD